MSKAGERTLSTLIYLLICVLLISCEKGESAEKLIFSDDTPDAAQKVVEANENLNKIKIIYNENEAKREELKDAIKNNDVEKVRSISKELNDLINDGQKLGQDAIDKISEAQEMNINPDFKEYLHLKEQSLQSQMDAFENYRQAALSLRDGYDPKDEKQHEDVKNKFNTVNENFQKLWEESKQYSKQANDLAKESAKKSS